MVVVFSVIEWQWKPMVQTDPLPKEAFPEALAEYVEKSNPTSGTLKGSAGDALQGLSKSDQAIIHNLIHLIQTKDDDKLPAIRLMLRNIKVSEQEKPDASQTKTASESQSGRHRRSA